MPDFVLGSPQSVDVACYLKKLLDVREIHGEQRHVGYARIIADGEVLERFCVKDVGCAVRCFGYRDRSLIPLGNTFVSNHDRALIVRNIAVEGHPRVEKRQIVERKDGRCGLDFWIWALAVRRFSSACEGVFINDDLRTMKNFGCHTRGAIFKEVFEDVFALRLCWVWQPAFGFGTRLVPAHWGLTLF